ncbi:MAG: SGNH/GDSL hydrolase family protein, partial [Planctomycetes bacterium]|nr:SGNH/GDSL hydrolase family protein [Planctomycetota bacterium]
VLAIGDSWTFGVGVPGPMTWPEVLEDLLRARRRGPVQVVNAGVATGHQSPDGYDRWFADRGSALDPDLVVVGFSLNDLGPVPMLSYQPVPKEPILGGWSRFLDHVVWRVRQRRAREAPRDHLLPFLELARQFEQWQQTQRGLRALRQIADERGITLVVAVFPMLTELERYPYGRLHDIVDEFCAAEGIRCVDLRDRFLGRVDEDLWVHPADPHPNRLGHRLLAEGIDEFLQREGLDRAGR